MLNLKSYNNTIMIFLQDLVKLLLTVFLNIFTITLTFFTFTKKKGKCLHKKNVENAHLSKFKNEEQQKKSASLLNLIFFGFNANMQIKLSKQLSQNI